MSPRQTRSALKQSIITTRSRKQKINFHDNETKPAAKRQKRKKSEEKKPVKNTLKTSMKQSTETESSNGKTTSNISMQKKSSRQKKHNYRKRKPKEDTFTSKENKKIDFYESFKIKNKDNILIKKIGKNNASQQNTSQSLTLHKETNKKSQRKITVTHTKTSPILVTPKSTPPKLSLTPHRSKKTPKKSPVSLSSPKTHSLAVPKLLKSRRKLSLVTYRDNLDICDEKSPKSKKDSLGDIAISKESLSLSSVKKNHKKSDVNLKAIVHILSKSPKEKYLRSKKSNLKLLSPSQVRKSLQKSSLISVFGSPSTLAKARIDETRSKNLLALKRRLLDSKLSKILTASQVRNMLSEPIVLLEKLPSEINQNTLTDKTKSDILMKKTSFLTSAQNRSKMSISETFIKSKATHNSNTKSRKNINRSPKIKHNALMQRTDRSLVPLMSSTPQENKMSINIKSIYKSNIPMESTNNAYVNTKLKSKNLSKIQSLSILNGSVKSIDNISQSLFDINVSNTSQSKFPNITTKNDTYNVDNMTVLKKQEKKNNTYELEQPQILSLKQIIKKRTSKETILHENTKRTKQQLADVTSDANVYKSTKKLIKLPLRKLHIINANRNSVTNSAHKLQKNETGNLSRNSFISSFKKRSSRTNAVVPRTKPSKIETPKTFKSIEKQSEKKSSTKKMPNFERIHEKLFSKAESLVDAKQRLEDRYATFTLNKVFPKINMKKKEKKLLPTDTNDGTHNRFGFRLRKSEATHLILKKQTVCSRETKQQEARTMLKQVRTNRRFELQMKTRNLVS